MAGKVFRGQGESFKQSRALPKHKPPKTWKMKRDPVRVDGGVMSPFGMVYFSWEDEKLSWEGQPAAVAWFLQTLELSNEEKEGRGSGGV